MPVPTSQDLDNNWNYRISASRQITIKAKNANLRKISAIDISTNLPFPLEIPTDIPMESLGVEKGYFITFKVYTVKRAQGVRADFVEFFEVLDIDQMAEDFIKSYWLYPDYIKFEAIEAEPL